VEYVLVEGKNPAVVNLRDENHQLLSTPLEEHSYSGLVTIDDDAEVK
jgi:hypothetical protein